MSKKVWLFLSLVLFVAGCGGASPSAAPKTAGSPEPQSFAQQSQPQPGSAPADFSADAPASAGPATQAQSAPPAPPAPEKSSAGSSSGRRHAESSAAPKADRAPESRPGLGTEWGETRTSRVHEVSFIRDTSRPFAIAALNYNDRRGVDAMANIRGVRAGRDIEIGGGAITVALKDQSGNQLETMQVGSRMMVVGQAGQRYSIVLTNRTGHRFESVITVDGLDVVNGKAGTMENRGYVLNPFATVEIEGFRQSTQAVAAFRFAAVGESYAAQMGAARNVGVIGAAFFSERGDTFVDREELRTRDTASPFPADPRFAQPPRR